MDPFSALSIATSVAQFVEFGCSLFSETRQIYKSLDGATVSQVETSLAATRLLELSERMKFSLRHQTLPKPPDLPPIHASSPPPPPEELLRDNFGTIKQAHSEGQLKISGDQAGGVGYRVGNNILQGAPVGLFYRRWN
jgi:hypothetical protein